VEGEHTAAETTRVERGKLIGLEVVTVAGDRLGVLEEVILTGANDVYEVRDGKKSILLPAIAEVIVSVDLDAGRMVVDPLPGLL
jgi:16S rRNA processing protein RimM